MIVFQKSTVSHSNFSIKHREKGKDRCSTSEVFGIPGTLKKPIKITYSYSVKFQVVYGVCAQCLELSSALLFRALRLSWL